MRPFLMVIPDARRRLWCAIKCSFVIPDARSAIRSWIRSVLVAAQTDSGFGLR
ncbi:MAG: hypothetical protein KJS83_07340 [Xanthomonadaceae bacterium]|nr:hypothetical protein [Xanthomonadaceae bacterium]